MIDVKPGELVLLPSGRRAQVDAVTPDGDVVLRYRCGERELVEVSAAFLCMKCIWLRMHPPGLTDRECQMPARVTRVRMRQAQED